MSPVIGIFVLIVLAIAVMMMMYPTGENQFTLMANHLEGLRSVICQYQIQLRTKEAEKCLEFSVIYPKQEIILPFDQIIGVNYVSWERYITKRRSPMAAGLAGGAIGGHTMAVVSAIDAQSRPATEHVKAKFAIEILYHPKGDPYTAQRIVVKPNETKAYAEKWAETLCRCAGLPEPQYIAPKEKGPTYL